jgi:hypothetical protein
MMINRCWVTMAVGAGTGVYWWQFQQLVLLYSLQVDKALAPGMQRRLGSCCCFMAVLVCVSIAIGARLRGSNHLVALPTSLNKMVLSPVWLVRG